MTAVPVTPPVGRATLYAVGMSVRLWVRDSTRSLGVSPRVLLVAAGVVLAGAIAGSLAIAAALPRLGSETVPPGVLEHLRGTMAALLWAVAGAAVVLFQLLTPRHSRLTDLLRLLPVPRMVTAVTGTAPSLVFALVLTATVSGPAVVLLADASGTGPATVVPGALLLALGLMPLVALLFAAVAVALQRVRVPQHHALTGAALAGMAVALAPTLVELSSVEVAWLPHRGLANAGTGSVLSWGFLAVWCLGGMAVFAAGMARLPEDPVARPSRVLAGLGVPSGRLAARSWYELVVLARAPQYAAAVLFTSVAVAAFLAVWWVVRSQYLTLLVSVVFLPYFLVCVQSYGHTRPTHWIGNHLLARPLSWVGPKAVVCLGLATVLAVPGVAVAAATGLLPWAGAAAVLVRALPAWAAAMVAGVVVPYNTEQPLSVGLSITMASALYAATMWATGRVSADTAMVAPLVAAALLLGCYLVVARAVRAVPSHA